ncbi:MAG: hypothetical protein DHS20C01_04680 [marine bacterium B5-7]|nr:MAG: hypothetical protein DHS20C01_04680 [marine bacterium B5-7]
MRRLILAMSAALWLAACSSGGSTSSTGGSITGATSGTTGLFMFVILTPPDFSSDTKSSDCTVPPDGVIDQFVTSDIGSVTITIRDNSLVATTSNKGVVFTSYTVSYTPITPGGPALASRRQSESIPVVLGDDDEASATAPVVLVELDTTKPEFNARNPAGKVYTYNITVTFRGSRIDTGAPVAVSGSTSMELGDFCEGT